MRRRWLIAAVLVAAASAAVARLGARPDGEWVPVEITDLALEVEISGRLKAADSALIGPPQIPGIHRFKIAMMIPEGEAVEAGTPVLGFDTSELEQRLRALRTEVEEAEGQIERHRVDLEVKRQQDELEMAEARARLRKAKIKSDVPEDLVSSVASRQALLELELAEIEVARLEDRIAATRRAGGARIAAVRSKLERARGDVAEAEAAIERMTRTAPRTGVVTYVTDWNNQKMKVGDSVWFRFNVLEIPDLTTMEAEGEVEEALAGRLAPEQKVKLRLDAHPDELFTGTIRDISSSVQEKSWNNPLKIVRLRVDLDHTDPERMRPGMRFKGTVESELLRQVLTVPVTSVYTTASGPVVQRRTTFGWEEVAVDLGSRNQERVLVLDGVEEGDLISSSWRSS